MPRILVVDDSRTLRKVVTSTLERHGYEADAACDGMDALEMLRGPTAPYDLVLLDFVMPKMNGYQFCRVVRDDAELCAQPIVLMSAKSDKIRDTFVQQTGALDALTKPFDARALVVVVENALRRVERGHQSQARIELAEREPVSFAPPPPSAEDLRARVVQEVSEQFGVVLSQLERSATETGNIRSFGQALTPEVLKKLAGVLGELDGEPSLLSGELGMVPIGAVLQLLQMERMTGNLTITRGDVPKNDAPTEVTVYIRTGLIDLAQSRGKSSDEFRLGRYMVEAGLVTAAEVDAVVRGEAIAPPSPPEPNETMRSLGEPAASGPLPDSVGAISSAEPSGTSIDVMTTPLLGDALMRTGRISKEQLNVALTRQSSELLYEVLRWPLGRFDFRRSLPSPSAKRAKLGLSVPSLVMEGFRRVDEWRLLEKKLGGFGDVLVRDPVALAAMDASDIEKAESAVLEAIDGKRSIREVIAASHLSSFDACRVLVQLLEARLVRRTS